MAKEITVKNKTILNAFQAFKPADTEQLVSTVRQPESWAYTSYDVVKEWSQSSDYLEAIRSGRLPAQKYSYTNIFGETLGGQVIINAVKEVCEFDHYFTALYNPKGFVGWHCDHPFPGWFIMISYSKDGAGTYSYFDQSTNSIIRLQDSHGWMVRTGYIGLQKKDTYWHAINSPCPRYTWLFMFESEENFNDAVKRLTS